jgi:hypothetical protein
MFMEQDAPVETGKEDRFCPTCGTEEGGHFCRVCGALLDGEELVLCPRCHQVVPGGQFCNQCGQSLRGIALELRQLAMAGDAFWMTSETDSGRFKTGLDDPAQADFGSSLQIDESVRLDDADLPDWLQELASASEPAASEARVYPSLEPIKEGRSTTGPGTLFVMLILLMFVLMLGLVILTITIALDLGG